MSPPASGTQSRSGEREQAASGPALQLDGVCKSFRRETGETVLALDHISFTLAHGGLAALVGPDGAGKTTLLRLLAGLMKADRGVVTALGFDAARDPQAIQSRIAFMPQKFGLYDDLTVRENLDLYADLHGVSRDEKQAQYPRLMAMTGLDPFQHRLAGQLSGGMKQKLGLACTLVRTPELLLLDEPTAGVDPLSRRELWEIIHQLVKKGLTVLLSSSFLAEAEACERVLVLNAGKKLAEGPPTAVADLARGRTFLAQPPAGTKARDFQARLLGEPDIVDAVPEGGLVRVVTRAGAGAAESGLLAGVAARPTPARLEDGFMVLLQSATGATPTPPAADEAAAPATGGAPDETMRVGRGVTPSRSGAPVTDGAADDTMVEVRQLERRYGKFVAVDQVSFTVRRGEIFGLLGPNGAGKTTTFRMLCGLLPASGGVLKVAGIDVRQNRAPARQHLGYVAQKFSLYAQLSVGENLDFFARAYGLGGGQRRERIAWATREFQLGPFVRLPSAQLPGGFKQRLAMAAALLHRPEMLFLDEPTSGADPFARRDFWRRITALAAGGVTVIVTTHFMAEAEYCDRAAILDHGRLLAQGTPAELRALGPAEPGWPATMEDAFIAIVRGARDQPAAQAGEDAA